jgi:glycosyltransferase involved in cell wall biosynthesis
MQRCVQHLLADRSERAALLAANTTVLDAVDAMQQYYGVVAVDEADFQRQLAELIESPNRLAPLGQAARQTCLARHRWSSTLDRWEELLGRLVGER